MGDPNDRRLARRAAQHRAHAAAIGDEGADRVGGAAAGAAGQRRRHLQGEDLPEQAGDGVAVDAQVALVQPPDHADQRLASLLALLLLLGTNLLEQLARMGRMLARMGHPIRVANPLL